MKFNKLKAGMQGLIPGLAISLFVISCNDEQSANNSTPGAKESNTDTSAVTNIAPPALLQKNQEKYQQQKLLIIKTKKW